MHTKAPTQGQKLTLCLYTVRCLLPCSCPPADHVWAANPPPHAEAPPSSLRQPSQHTAGTPCLSPCSAPCTPPSRHTPVTHLRLPAAAPRRTAPGPPATRAGLQWAVQGGAPTPSVFNKLATPSPAPLPPISVMSHVRRAGPAWHMAQRHSMDCAAGEEQRPACRQAATAAHSHRAGQQGRMPCAPLLHAHHHPLQLRPPVPPSSRALATARMPAALSNPEPR